MVEATDMSQHEWRELCKRVYDALCADDPDTATEILELKGFGADDLTSS